MKPRYYLTGLDWLMNAVDLGSRRCTSAGNSFQIVLELESHLDIDRLSSALDDFVNAIPFLSGYVSRHWTWEPCWRIPSKLRTSSIRLETIKCAESETSSLLQGYMNLPVERDNEYIVFRYHELVEGGSLLSATFDHRLFDAKGGEMFLSLLGRYLSGEESLENIQRTIEPRKPTLLNRWRERFESGRHIIRHLLKISDCEVRTLDVDLQQQQKISSFVLPLDVQQTKQFDNQVNSKAGFMMFMPYSMAMVTRIFDAVFSRSEVPKSYIVPCTTDVRGVKADDSKTFLNHCSMMFFRIDPQHLDDKDVSLPALIKDQFYSQCKDNIPQHLATVLVLMRVMPIRTFTWLMCKKMTKFFVPFSFAFSSFVSEFSGQKTFCGATIKNLYHFPRIPPQVGVGFFFNKFNGHLNATVMCYDSVVDNAEKEKINSLLKSAMISDHFLEPQGPTSLHGSV